MFLPLLLTALAPQDTLVFSGRAGQTAVPIPRIEATISVDGRLDEPAWAAAARLTGFSQYQPVDGRPAEEPTEVLVWYAPDAIHFGIRAREVHGDVVRATRANRDNIGSEDHVQILLDTGNDRRIAFLFGVNALGVQQDGTRSDQFAGGAGGFSATGGGFRDMNPLEGNIDLNPDYRFDSSGRLVEGGYEVEVRIPFKSLRYQERAVQTWGIHVLRRVQHSGFQDTWAPAVRANASFVGQAGTLEGLQNLRRGLVLELTPTVTGRLEGAPHQPSGWGYTGVGEFGGDVRWGIRQDLTLNGTFNPDFSQVEADVGQVTLNERFALFYPEKRPFFLDGIELFDSPNQLIYTRQIVAPHGGVKLSGKLGNTNVAALSALDDSRFSWSDSRPVFGAARLRHDLGASSTLGTVLTTREDGGDYSRLAGADLRIYHSRLYWAEVQAVQSWTDSAGTRLTGPMFEAAWDRTGRAWGFHLSGKAIGPGFRAATGFVNRTGVIDVSLFNRLSFYGDEDALVQTWTGFVRVNRIWHYDSPSAGAFEGSESLTPTATLRGGWRLSGGLSRSFFSYDPVRYAAYTVPSPGSPSGTVAFTVPDPERNLWNGSLSVTTPTWQRFSASASIGFGESPIFAEAAPGRSNRWDLTLDARPTAGLRATAQLVHFTLDRSGDDSRFSTETIPRLKLEYQLNRAVFFRFVGQYASRERAPLSDRLGRPIHVNGVRDQGAERNEFRMDWLFSYRPVPGTLVYFGYGSTLEEPESFNFRHLDRTVDGFFAKVSYQFSM